MAVLKHDLFDAFFRADDENAREMKNLVMFVHDRLPGNCHGSLELVREWHEMGGIQGQKALEG